MPDDVLRGVDAPRPLPDHLRAALEERLLAADAELPALLRTAEAPRPLSPGLRDALSRSLVRRRRPVPAWLIGAAAAAVLVLGGLAALPSAPAGAPTAQPVPAAPVTSPDVVAPSPVPPAAGAPAAVAAPPAGAVQAMPQPSPRPPASAAAETAEVGSAGGATGGAPAAAGPPRGVTDMAPDEGPLSGGTRVTLTGHDLSRAVRVLFNGRAGTDLVVESDTRLSVVTPAAPEPARAAVEVHLSTDEVYLGESPFAYLAVPAVTALEPAEGPATGGNVVVVTGRDFTERSTVVFGDTRADEVQVVSDTQLRVIAPAHLPGPVGVAVTTAGGTSNRADYVYRP